MYENISLFMAFLGLAVVAITGNLWFMPASAGYFIIWFCERPDDGGGT